MLHILRLFRRATDSGFADLGEATIREAETRRDLADWFGPDEGVDGFAGSVFGHACHRKKNKK